MSVWSSLRRRDKAKLVYAYVVSPVLIYSYISGGIINELNQKHGGKILREPATLRAVFGLANSIAWRSGILAYLPLILPATVIRFIVPRHELKYGLEMYCYMLLSMFLTRVLNVVILGEQVSTLGFLDCLILYCVLSYKANEYQEIPRSYRYGLTSLTLVAVFIILYTTTGQFTNDKRYIFPIWEGIALCIVLNTHRNSTTPEEPSASGQSEGTHSSSFSSQQSSRNEPADMAARLVDIALAHIGRPTQSPNPYMTPSQTDARHIAERPFLRLLSEVYKDAGKRKAMAQHFMLYKEMTLFVIFAMELGKDKGLHAAVRTMLKARLSEGLPQEVISRRNERWRTMSEKFYESYTRTHDMAGTLEYVFWSTLPEQLRQGDVFGGTHLRQIFMYTQKAVMQEVRKSQNLH